MTAGQPVTESDSQAAPWREHCVNCCVVSGMRRDFMSAFNERVAGWQIRSASLTYLSLVLDNHIGFHISINVTVVNHQ